MDSHPTADHTDDEQLARAFLRDLRSRDWLRDSRIIFVVENNTANASNIAAVFRADRNCACVHQRPHEANARGNVNAGVGWCTAPREKKAMCLPGQLLVDRRRLTLAAPEALVCANPWRPSKTRVRDTVVMLLDEMERVREITILPKQPNHEKHVTVSGKCSPDGQLMQSQNDDLFMAYSLAAMIWERITSNSMPPGFAG
jgi:hypothetical protein